MSSTTYPVIEGPYWQDIVDQPLALQETLDSFVSTQELFRQIEEFRNQPHTRLVLTGMGSSLHALYPLELDLIAAGEMAFRVETSELIHSMPALLREGTLVIAVSQSGRSAEIVRLLDQNGGRANILGITNTPDSPLALEADLTLLMKCGDEFSVSTKTYLGTLLTLEIVSAIWRGESLTGIYQELQSAPSLVREYLSHWREHVRQLIERLENIDQLFVVGRGRSLASCGTGALIAKESTRIAAEAMSSAAFRHGPMEVTSPEKMVMVCEGEGSHRRLNKKLIQDIREAGGTAELIGPDSGFAAFRIPSCSASLLPLLEILPIQIVTLAIAARKGFEAGRFELASKVTIEE